MAADDNESKTAIALVDPLVGTIFDKRFRIEERIAAGGFGAIYRAKHVKSGHPIALKVLLPALAQDLGVVARFRREGATMTTLRNPHTITAYELGQAADRTLFIVMELLSGESLYDHYSVHGPFEWKRLARIARQVCESLEEAHALGIVHRDLKPTNIHLEDKDGEADYVKVLDFGIAKILGGSDFDASDITNAGTMIGTLDYMSPEQMVGGAVTGQSDIYTLGIVMYEMLAGTRPFPEATTAASALASMLKTTPQPLYLRAPVPEEISTIVMRCLEREVARRYRAVGELMVDLDRLLGSRASTLDKTKTLSLERAPAQHGDDHGDDATAITPPPEKILESLRTPKADVRRQLWEDEESKTVARRPEADPYGPTVPAPPLRKRGPEDSGLELKTPTLERDTDTDDARGGSRRRDDDSGVDVRTPTFRREEPPLDLETTPVSRYELDDAGSSAPPAPRRGQPAARKPPTQPPPTPAAPPVAPAPRPIAARYMPTPVPNLVVAPFSTTQRAPGIPTPSPGSVPPGVPMPQSGSVPPGVPMPPSQHPSPQPPPHSQQPSHLQQPSHSQQPSHLQQPSHGSNPGQPGNPFAAPGPGSNPFAAGPGSNPFASGPGSNPFAAGPGSNPFAAPGPGSNPFAAPGPGSNSFGAPPGNNSFGAPPGSNSFGAPPGSNPFGAPLPQTPMTPPQPMPPNPAMPRPQYDMGHMAARDAAVRRLVWIIVLVLGTGIGFLVAMRL